MSTVEIPNRLSFTDDCPFTPTGASEWERQQANVHWSNAVRYYREIALNATDKLARLVDPDGGASFRDNNDADRLSHAKVAEAALGQLIESIEHRIALGEQMPT